MKVILNEFVQHLGDAGDTVKVAAGYARNYLIPQKLAFEATKANRKTYENNLKHRARTIATIIKKAEDLKTKLEATEPLEFVRKSGEGGKLFGSVTSADIESAINERGFTIDKKRIALNHPIRSLGETEITVKLNKNVAAKLKVVVTPEAVTREEKTGEDDPQVKPSSEKAEPEEA